MNFRVKNNTLRTIGISSLSLFLAGLILFITSFTFPNYITFDSVGYYKAITQINDTVKIMEASLSTSNPARLKNYNSDDEIWRTTVRDSSNRISVSFYYFFKNSDNKVWYYFKTNDPVHLDIPGIDSTNRNKLLALKDSTFRDSTLTSNSIEKIFGRDFLYTYPFDNFKSKHNRGDTLLTIGMYFMAFLFFSIVAFSMIYVRRRIDQARLLEKKYEETESRVKNNPEEIKPSWDMAQLTLEQYFIRNLKQINMIFYVSVFVMLAGFFLIGFGIILSYKYPDKTFVPLVSASAGILTEFIGATFIFIYNSTIKQAITYTDSLEQINSVGMSIKIIDSIKLEDGNKDKLNDAKIEIAKMLIMRAKELNKQ